MVAGIEKQTFMRTKSVLLCVSLFIGIAILSCGKDEIETPSVPNEKDTTVIVPPKEDIVYVIDTTKKITINEIKFWGDYNMATVSGTWNEIAHGGYSDNQKWVAVGGYSRIATSTDGGTNWSVQSMFGNDPTYAFRGVASNGYRTMIFTSEDGISWSSKSASGDWYDVVYDGHNAAWVAVGTDVIATSTSGSGNYWDTQDLSGNWRGVDEGNGNVVVAGRHGGYWYLAISQPNDTYPAIWYLKQVPDYPTDVQWNGIAYGGNSRWVVVGNGGYIATALNTDNLIDFINSTWTVQVVGGSSNNWMNVVNDYWNNRWIAVGSSGQIAISTDGVNWTTKSVEGTWYGVAIKR